MADLQHDLESVLRSNNINIVPDFTSSKIQRDKAAWLRCFRWEHQGREYLSAFYGDFSTGLDAEWKSWGREDLNGSAKEFEGMRAKFRAEETAERERLQDEARNEAQKDFAAAAPCDSHPYARKKGLENIQRYGVRLGANDMLLAPLCDADGTLWSYQTIAPDGTKRFKKFGRKKGLFHTLVCHMGQRPEKIYIAEGLATAASVAMALDNLRHDSNYAVVCAFDAGNLLSAAQALREKNPDAKIILCADNDALDKDGKQRLANNNPGIVKATEAANAVNGQVIQPHFDLSDPKVRETRPSDFNDMLVNDGLDALTKQILEQLNPPQLEPVQPEEKMPKKKKYIHMLPDSDGKRGLSTRRNLEFLINHVGATVRYNVIAKKREVLIPGQSFSIDNYDNCSVSFFYDMAARLQMPTGLIVQYLSAIADANQYNPVKTWIESKPWDGKSRLVEFFNTVEVQDDFEVHLRDVFIFKWMLSAIAAAYRPNGTAAHGVLVFQGLQGLGKTGWFRKLVPQELNLQRDGVTLDPTVKDSVLQVIKYWLIELGEIDATFKKADLAHLKSFITKDIDEVRAPYAPEASTFPRRTVFFGSVNEQEFLADTSGNRRFWVVRCKSINYTHDIDMQQVWAEIAEAYANGQSWHLDAEELTALNKSNAKSEVVSGIEELIATRYPWNSSVLFERWITASEVLSEMGIKNPSKREKDLAGKVLRKFSKKEPKRIDGFKQYFVPPLPK